VRVIALEALKDSVMLDGAAKVRTPAGLASSPLPITARDEEGFQFRGCACIRTAGAAEFTRLQLLLTAFTPSGPELRGELGVKIGDALAPLPSSNRITQQ
jgi:hypothetical protein